MARISKKIRKRLIPKQSDDPKPKEKVGKDYLLIGVILFTFILMVVGWPTLTNMSRALYFTLLLSLSMTYTQRHYELNELQSLWVNRISIASMGMAVALFIFNLGLQLIAD